MKVLSLAVLLGASIVLADNAETLKALKAANTAVERIAVLKDDSDFVFDFLDPANKAVKGAGGRAVGAAVNTFPALFGTGIAMTLGFMEPCSLNSPHTHPRATEVLIMINGTIEAGFLAENGVRFVMNTIDPLEATVFPRGSIHFQANLGCKPVLFAATLNNEDPGTLQIAQRFFALPADVVGASLGGVGVQDVAALAKYIPDNLIQATEACFKQCGLTPPAKGSQPTTQQQSSAPSSPAPSQPAKPQNYAYEGNGTPNNWLGEGSTSSSPGTDSPNKPTPIQTFVDNAVSSAKGWFSHLDGTKIALITLTCVNIAAILAGLIFLCVRLAQRRKLRKNGGMHAMPTTTSSRVVISGPRALLTGAPASRGKYAAAEFELPLDDAASSDAITPRKYEDPYDKQPSRAPSPLPPAHSGPYRD